MKKICLIYSFLFIAISQTFATGKMINNSSITISINDVSRNETDAGTNNFCFEISTNSMPEAGISLTATTVDGTAKIAGTDNGKNDYTFKTATIHINEDFPSPQTFCVSVKGDQVVELNEHFLVELTDLDANGQDIAFADNEGQGNILNDDQTILSFANAPFSVEEGNAGTKNYQFSYNLSKLIDVAPIVKYAHTDGTASTSDTDFYGTSGALFAGTGGTRFSFFNIIRGDTKVEPDETFTVTFTEWDFKGRDVVFEGGGSSISTTVIIINDDFEWYIDADGDGYGGSVVVNGTRPANGYLLSELSGNGTDDCNDSDPAINPDGTEICDGQDNNCDGQIDEGVNVYNGDLMFTTQAQVDAWDACLTIIDGNMTITGGNINDLTPLSGITSITGNLTVYYNGALTNLSGLEYLNEVGGSLTIYYNFALSDCCAISGLLENNGVAGLVVIFFNATGCNSETEVVNQCAASQHSIEYPNETIMAASTTSAVGIQLFPNPAQEKIQLQFGQDFETGHLEIFDAQGRLVKQQNLMPHTRRVQLDINELPTGFYLVKVETDGAHFTEKLLVE